MIKPLNQKESHRLVENNYIGHLAYVYQGRPFVVPITYFYTKENNMIICYSNEGHRITAMRKNTQVAMEVSEISSINNWKSAIVHGHYEELEGSTAKARLHEFAIGVKKLVHNKEQKVLDYLSEFSSKAQGTIPVVFMVKADEITGKMRKE